MRAKMLYSSSRTSLKDGLGKALFIDDYFFSDIVRMQISIVIIQSLSFAQFLGTAIHLSTAC